ncbi:glycosyltransferase family 2 protein, partial [Candidatus Binatia bacterium]|nr:glycosyltransferase family 2 protein [Candidatus Binatia bacterium]
MSEARIVDAELPEVTFVIVTCDGRDLLAECLTSLRAQDYPERRTEILVYDNGSSDGTVEWLAREHPTVRVVAARENTGFAAPNNRAAEAASSPLLCLVNNDMRFARTFLRELVAARSTTGAACVGARVLSADGGRIEFDGGTMSFYGHGAPWRHGADASRHAVEAAPRDSLFASGGAMLIERETFLAAGGFDESYFAYFEDVDLGWRLWTLGARCVHAPAARAFHREHASEHLLGPGRRLAMLERNALCSVWKNYEPERGQRLFGCALALAAERARLEPARRTACEQGVLEAIALLP